MEKFNYYFNTQSKIDEVLNGPVNKSTMNSVIFHLIWYAYYNISKEECEIVKYIEDWMHGKTNIFHLSAYAKTIRRMINRMDKIPWRNIKDTVKIRQSELDYISSFNDIKKEKLLFCYLAIAKFMDMSRQEPNHWESEKDSVVFKMARVTIPAKERDYYIYDMIHEIPCAKIYLNYRNDDTSKRTDYISDDENDPVILELDESNYYELAYTYLNWKNSGGFKKCKACGRLFRVKGDINNNKSKTNELNRTQYCRKCAPIYEPKYKGKDETALDYEPKKIICIDCGNEFYLDNPMAGRTYRCEECQKEANKERYKKYNKKRRS